MKKIFAYLKKKVTFTDQEIDDAKAKVEETTKVVVDKTKAGLDEGSKLAKQGISDSIDYAHVKAREAIDTYQKSHEPLSDDNWYYRSAEACEHVSDALMREDSGTSRKVTKAIAGKLGAAGTSVGIFSIASLLGTASTGTAIGTLSGAAFTSASLAWLGGSMVMGSMIIGVVSIAGGIGAVLGAGWVFKNYVYGAKRERSELDQKEQNIIDVCLSLAAAFHQEAKAGKTIDSITAKALYADALQPLCEDLLTYKTKTESWTYLAEKRFENAVDGLEEVSGHLKQFIQKRPNASIGVTTAVFLQLLSGDLSSFDDNELLVLDALRRSNNTLTDATNEELSEYIQGLEPEQLAGLQNNVKGIYHELRFVDEINSNGDEYIAEIFESTNHAGADVRIINTLTGETKEIQLKATEYINYIKRHNERYEDIEVFATSEVASQSDAITSTGMSNAGLKEDVEGVVDDLDSYTDSTVASSMTVAAMIALAKNAKVLLRGESISVEEKESMVKDGAIAAGVAGLVSLLLG